MKRRFVMGDIHGMYDKYKACLEAVKFDYEVDELIQLGDIVDRGPDSFKIVEDLLKIKNLIAIKGNHDDCFYEGLFTGRQSLFTQGAKETIISYIRALDIGDKVTYNDLMFEHLPIEHTNFFKNQLLYYIDENLNLFVHGGFNRHYTIEDETRNSEQVLLWDRDLLMQARSYSSMRNMDYPFKIAGCAKGQFKEIFLGHTPVQYLEDTNKPLKYANINLLDTGCGKTPNAPLTIMNLETREIIQK